MGEANHRMPYEKTAEYRIAEIERRLEALEKFGESFSVERFYPRHHEPVPWTDAEAEILALVRECQRGGWNTRAYTQLLAAAARLYGK